MKVKESLNLIFNESPPPTKLSPLVDDDIGEEQAVENQVDLDNNIENETIEDDASAICGDDRWSKPDMTNLKLKYNPLNLWLKLALLLIEERCRGKSLSTLYPTSKVYEV
ncbi:hypothetical protein Tco_0382815 [Tanacetum coccineum]